MKLVIFGATGRTGIPLVQQALDAGHDVIGFVRSRTKMPIQHERLTLIEGDVMNLEDVQRAIPVDADAVFSTLAPLKSSPPDMLTCAADHIMSVMQERGIMRLIYMTGAGVSAPQDQPNLINHIIKFALKTLAGDVLRQSEEAVEKIRLSNLDWIIVRAPMLTDSGYTGKIRVGWVGVNTGARLARADAASFMLGQVTLSDHLKQSPMISN